MHCSLGVFDLNPAYLGLLKALAGLLREVSRRPSDGELRRHVARLGAVDQGSRDARDVPDLLDVVEDDREWVNIVYDELLGFSCDRLVTLECCEFIPERRGHVAFSVQFPECRLALRKTEHVVAGLAVMRERSGVLRMWPRIACVESGRGVLHMVDPGPFESVAEAVRWCISKPTLETAMNLTRRAAEQMVIDPSRLLQGSGEVAMQLPAVLEQYRAAGDRTWWGLVSALSSLADGSRDLASRLLIEEQAGALALRLCGAPPAAPGRYEGFSESRTGTFGDVD